ncbi:AraC family transcriptional regulator [Myxosarcina sp. GI1]|uniref:helix-turn-helix domain-containing protein n=1 Tax=Myxosarcina sp. GI1 TaxID=1541065 RepID=UPI001C1071D6|nr:helix-turn-helix domain-containing protein [Myxosarcina sp. GI1]
MKLKSESIGIDFYLLSIKSNFNENIDYGKTSYDKSDSCLFLDRPDAILQWNLTKSLSGYHILIDAKFFNRYASDRNFIDYDNHETLFLTEDEKNILIDIFAKAYFEYKKSDFSIKILVAYANLILAYTHSFYQRQFETRSKIYNQVVADFYKNLDTYFDDKKECPALPTVSFFAKKSNLSPNYFGDVIKHFTGSSPLEHIHDRIIRIAKHKLRQPHLTIREIAYSLGFDYPTYFTRLFKKETGITPTDFRDR